VSFNTAGDRCYWQWQAIRDSPSPSAQLPTSCTIFSLPRKYHRSEHFDTSGKKRSQYPISNPPQQPSQPTPPPTLILIILTIIPKPLLQLPAQPPITPQTLDPSTPNLPLLPPEIKPNHTLALLVAESLEIALPISIAPTTTAAIGDPPGRPREPRQEI
jgi:hypothetical protein